MLVCHKCDVRCCVNPEHLFLGTYQDNVDDMWRKGRGHPGSGERHGYAKLTEEMVREIRASNESSRKIAPKYGVQSAAIRMLRRRETWKSVE